MENFNLQTSPLSALVAEFNRLTGQSVKKFTDRATAIRRLTPVLPKAPQKPTKVKAIQMRKAAGTATKQEQLVAFLITPRSLDDIASQFGIGRLSASSYLSYLGNPKRISKALGTPVKVLRTEDGKVYVK